MGSIGCVRNLRVRVPFNSDQKISWVSINEVAGSNVHRVRDFIDAKCILLKICGCHDTHGTHANAPSQGYVHSKPTLKEFWHFFTTRLLKLPLQGKYGALTKLIYECHWSIFSSSFFSTDVNTSLPLAKRSLKYFNDHVNKSFCLPQMRH